MLMIVAIWGICEMTYLHGIKVESLSKLIKALMENELIVEPDEVNIDMLIELLTDKSVEYIKLLNENRLIKAKLSKINKLSMGEYYE